MNENKYNGYLNIYKEPGRTSMAVVARLRHIIGMRKIGHAGTLDPMAEGVLPMALGRATKSIDVTAAGDKVYEAVMKLGTMTDTQDITGTVLSEYSGQFPSEEEIRTAAETFIGRYDQITPMYSARKINGRRFYDIARKGGDVEQRIKPVEILSLTVLSVDLPYVSMTVRCTKGTYIRTLCHDIGQKLGCGACMSSLKRTRVGIFGIDTALHLEEVEEIMKRNTLEELLFTGTATAVSIGKFDGAHRGHQALIKELRKAAEKNRLKTCTLILDTGKDSYQAIEQRRKALLDMDIDFVMALQLNEELMKMSAEQFLKDILIRKLGMKVIVGGEDISFGYKKEGNAEFLKKHAQEYGYQVDLIRKITIDLEGDGKNIREISSTLLREKLAEGDVAAAESILGHKLNQ